MFSAREGQAIAHAGRIVDSVPDPAAASVAVPEATFSLGCLPRAPQEQAASKESAASPSDPPPSQVACQHVLCSQDLLF
jgi:predicted DNA-binding transcriptional regulator YafY